VDAGVKATPLLTPLFQVYEAAPDPLRVTAVPAHTVWLFPAETEGKAFTVTVCAEDVEEHPAPLVTVTV